MRLMPCINLDGTDESELREFMGDAAQLAAYAKNMLSAKKFRKDGAISSALCCEKEAEQIYKRLPDDLKW